MTTTPYISQTSSPRPSVLPSLLLMRRIALMNQKGGVGKTTSTANLGACLAELGQRVLLFDMDPQANLSVHLGIDIYNLESSVYEVLLGEKDLAQVIHKTDRPGLDIVPSHIDLSGVEIELVSALSRENILRESLRKFEKDRPSSYDYCLIDCPPSLGLLAINAMTTAEEIFIPMQCEFFALQGMSKLLGVVEMVRERLNPTLEVSGIIICMADTRKNLTREVADEVRRYFGDRVFETTIRSNVRLAEAPSHGQSILEYDPRSPGALDYLSLAREVDRTTQSTRESNRTTQSNPPTDPNMTDRSSSDLSGDPTTPSHPPTKPQSPLHSEASETADPSSINSHRSVSQSAPDDLFGDPHEGA